MFKNRFLNILLAVFALIVGLLLCRAVLAFSPNRAQSTVVPFDLKTVIPSSWTVIPENTLVCDFDGDGADEWLIVYRYDPSNGLNYSLIGGVVYDSQVNRVPQAPSTESPYRPAFLIPYKLLPDIYTGKGQGYLAETSVQVTTYPPPVSGQPCKAQEIVAQGYSSGTQPTFLSVFRWAGDPTGYPGQHFVGNARIASGVGSTSAPVTEVYTYNRLNDRSLLCAVQLYARAPGARKEDLPPQLSFTEVPTAYTIDFCYGPPNDPAYPEGVVVALLRGYNPSDTDVNATFTGPSYLISGAQLPPPLVGLKDPVREPYRVVSVTTPGTLAPIHPAEGQSLQWTPTPGAPPQIWWIGQERATVTTQIFLDNQPNSQPRQVVWNLVSIANENSQSDVHWRVESATLQQ